MDYITFKQFIYTINIRNCYLSQEGKEINNNGIIRIYYGTEFKNDNYIEIGWYDYFNKDTVWKILKETLNKNILDSVITDFRYNDNYSCIEVCVAKKEDLGETLQEYQN